jgi:hypothetical protein
MRASMVKQLIKAMIKASSLADYAMDLSFAVNSLSNQDPCIHATLLVYITPENETTPIIRPFLLVLNILLNNKVNQWQRSVFFMTLGK